MSITLKFYSLLHSLLWYIHICFFFKDWKISHVRLWKDIGIALCDSLTFRCVYSCFVFHPGFEYKANYICLNKLKPKVESKSVALRWFSWVDDGWVRATVDAQTATPKAASSYWLLRCVSRLSGRSHWPCVALIDTAFVSSCHKRTTHCHQQAEGHRDIAAGMCLTSGPKSNYSNYK